MITKQEVDKARRKAVKLLKKAGIVLTLTEKQALEVADLGLGRLNEIGVEIVVYVNTKRYCAKELVLFPRQICPEHRHPPFNSESGKEETFRCRFGIVYLYVPGKPVKKPKAKLPQDKKDCFTVWHEIILKPGQQYTLPPNTLHWFQAGNKGAVVSEFSTMSRDEFDIFTDKKIHRITKVT